MAQREFMLKALESNDDLTPTKVMKYWEPRKALEVNPQKAANPRDLLRQADYYVCKKQFFGQVLEAAMPPPPDSAKQLWRQRCGIAPDKYK